MTTTPSFGRGLSFLALALVVFPALARIEGRENPIPPARFDLPREEPSRDVLSHNAFSLEPRATLRRADWLGATDSTPSEVVLRVRPFVAPTGGLAEAPPPPYPLLIPVVGIRPKDLTDTFADRRDSTRIHRAIDILAPTGTPVVAAAGGRILRLHTSTLGGLTVYQSGPTGGWVFYYAHLDGYAEGLRPGQIVAPGDTLGYVGETGNAPIPHLHFAVWKVHPGSRGLRGGRAVNPYPLLAGPEHAQP